MSDNPESYLRLVAVCRKASFFRLDGVAHMPSRRSRRSH